MNWKLNDNSLFAILLRSSWWISFAIAGAVAAVAVALLPEAYRIVGAVAGLPVSGDRMHRRVEAVSGAVRRPASTARSPRFVRCRGSSFPRAIEAAYRRQGYGVSASQRDRRQFRDHEGRTHRARQLQALEGGARTGVEALAEPPCDEGGARRARVHLRGRRRDHRQRTRLCGQACDQAGGRRRARAALARRRRRQEGFMTH